MMWEIYSALFKELILRLLFAAKEEMSDMLAGFV